MIRQLVVALVLMINAGVVLADIAPPPKNDGGEKTAVEPWWPEALAGVLGGSVGGTLGIVGAVFGICAGLGVARRFVVGLALAMIVFGAGVLLAGIAAVAGGQPYHVYYPLLLIGIITAVVFGCNYPFIKRRYEQQELQRISALDS